MKKIIEFTDESLELINELKKSYRVSTNKALIEKCLMVAAIVADESDQRGTITILRSDGEKFKLLITG
jgi:hypothetical protein